MVLKLEQAEERRELRGSLCREEPNVWGGCAYAVGGVAHSMGGSARTTGSLPNAAVKNVPLLGDSPKCEM